MKIPRQHPLLFVLLVFLSLPAMVRADDDSTTNTPKIIPVTPEIDAALARAMTNCPAPVARIHEGINTNGIYVLTGDLFNNGHTNALIDNTNNILLGEWDGTQWKAKTVIDAAPIWNSPNLNKEDSLGEKITATKPFYLLSLQGYPILVVGSDPDKYGQEYTALLLDPKNLRTFDSVTGYAVFDESKPHVQENFLVTSDGSRRKSEWETTYYFQIQKNHLIKIVDIGSDCPWRSGSEQSEETFHINIHQNKFTIRDLGYSTPFESVKGKVLQPKGGFIDTFEISNNDKPFAKVSFNLKDISDIYEFNTISNKEIPYITWKLSGLQRSLVDGGKGKKIESLAKIKVIGSTEAVKLLSP